MGWQRGRITLTWSEGHELHGLEVVMRRQPFGEVLETWLTEDEIDTGVWDSMTREQRVERSRRGAAHLAGLVVAWNLEDEFGEPVSPSTDNILRHCDADMINDMRSAYTSALTRVAPPLSPSSGAGPSEWDLPPQEVLTPETLIDHPV